MNTDTENWFLWRRGSAAKGLHTGNDSFLGVKFGFPLWHSYCLSQLKTLAFASNAVVSLLISTKARYCFPFHSRMDNIRIFVSDEWDEYVMEVYEWSTFGSILQLPGFQVVQGLPVIMVSIVLIYFFSPDIPLLTEPFSDLHQG